jgi:hypothetical protein
VKEVTGVTSRVGRQLEDDSAGEDFKNGAGVMCCGAVVGD